MFAKIYESEKLGQILVTKEYDAEEDTAKIAITLERNDVLVKFSIGVNSSEAQEELFKFMDLQRAETIIQEVLPPEVLNS